MDWNPKPPFRFQGFAPELFGFLRRLSQNNNKPWFDAHRDVYESYLLKPIKAFTAEAGQILRTLNPDFDTAARIGKTISRINNPIRVDKNRPAYRPSVYVTYTHSDASRSKSAAMYIRVNSHGVSVGFYPGAQRDSGLGPIQQGIASNQRVFHKYLTERRIPQRYWELVSTSEGEVTKWPLPKTTRRWASIDNLIVGDHFSDTDAVVGDRVFLDRVREILLDLYPLWIFAESEQVKDEFELYRETAHRLSRPLSKAAD